MGTFEKTGREIDAGVSEARRTSRRVARNVRVAGYDAETDVRALLDELDESLRDGTDADVEALRTRLRKQLANARTAFDDAQDTVRDRFQSAVSATEEHIQERPWETIGAVAGIAFLLGVIVGRS